MDTIFGIKKIQKRLNWPVVTLGVFDGVHLGHQRVIQKTINLANKRNGESVILTFDRHPKSFLSQKQQSCITSLEHRLVLFEQLGVDISVVLEFSRKIAEISAEDFITKIIHEWLGARVVVLGFNCSFGKNRRGNASMVCDFARKYGFEVITCDPVEFEGEITSSTTIRKEIIQGNLQKAKGMLGRRVSVFGMVIKGSGRGKGLGFPTANLNLHHEIKPPSGVYATKAYLDGREYNAITNIGNCPTFEKNTQNDEPVVEVHIIDFNESIYGKDLEVQFLYKLREETKFKNADELKRQLERDKMRFVNRHVKKVLTK
ncbi:MAG: riboflavin biosynthesis protein RibF [Planctomycetes bacterium GWA2_40_7]|nr:MAG: riboflavin biosynthesis protein RibF [Planctomycetes bacterium GWA2_40_7]OHB51140.1 MAG: riboflavin biosynthesis protein RibF [Planctomycetes bacterium GWF2_40_8]OHB86606.1 MAG: riboflavin biosynthesis protein RibF [Planctomycetes bacterium RIFCSPHIGHO2_02_FULL_40_12]OHC02414.1 MAG: riboflavin biosynthesis protein RibF [Planctomycetes bacterium RIFCSPLOWO2_12_FULL_40_19]